MEDNTKKIHPGSGRRNALTFNKGRQSDDQSINELKNNHIEDMALLM